MRKFFLISLLLIFSSVAYCQDIPRPVDWVNDFANVVSSEDKDRITNLIQELEEKSSVEITIVTVDSISPYDEREYARLLFDNWKPGKKGKDNGVLILLAVKDRAWRIETGYGIEGILPDGLCGEIGRNYMVPYFKQARYGEGLYQGVLKIYNIILGKEYDKASYYPKGGISENKLTWFDIFAIIFLMGIFGFFIYSSLFYRDKRYYGGSGYYGGYGGGSGGFGGGGFGGFGGGLGGGGGAGGKF